MPPEPGFRTGFVSQLQHCDKLPETNRFEGGKASLGSWRQSSTTWPFCSVPRTAQCIVEGAWAVGCCLLCGIP